MRRCYLQNIGIFATSLILLTNYLSAGAFAAEKYGVEIAKGAPIYVYNDGSMIPDKYNTGVNPNIPLTKMTAGANFTINGLLFRDRPDTGEGVMLIDPIDATIPENGVITIENYDFSAIKIRFVDYRHFSDNGGKIKLVFKNCKFYSFSSNNNSTLSVEFYDCDFNSVSGSYMIIERCKFHPTDGDAMIPFRNVTVKDSYIYTLGEKSSDGKHIDGFQSFGNKNFDTEIILFSNTRIEVPKIKTGKEGDWYVPYINAPAMISDEYSPYIRNITLENMHLNGGGYTIYYGCSKDCKELSGLTFKNVQVGYGHLFGTTYPTHGNTDAASIESATNNTSHVTSVYIGSAWKSSDGVHMSVTNEMLMERTLTCVSDSGTTTNKIAAHPKLTQRMEVKDIPTFDSLPYDLDVVVASASATNVKCYDTTDDNNLATAPVVRTVNFKSTAAPVQTAAPAATISTSSTSTKPVVETQKQNAETQENDPELPKTGADKHANYIVCLGLMTIALGMYLNLFAKKK